MNRNHLTAQPSTGAADTHPLATRGARWLLTFCGAWLFGLGAYFIFLRPALLPEDPRFIGASVQRLQEAAPGLGAWLHIVFTVMGGFMAGAGVLTFFLAQVAVPARLRGTGWAIALAGLTTVILMSAMNFQLHSDFRWVLLVPAVFWSAGLVAYILER
jgi:phage shock protein PspC (stress-responsive transcriptional regulator)